MMLTDLMCWTCGKETPHENSNCSICARKREAKYKLDESQRWNKLTTKQKLDELKSRLDSMRGSKYRDI